MDEKKIWDIYGKIQKSDNFPIGPHFSYQFNESPRRIIFSLSRYKFAMKMIGSNKKILELGCSDGLGTYYLSEFADKVVGVDFDELSINWAKENYTNDKISFFNDNFLGKKLGRFDAVVSYDVIGHIYSENEKKYMETVVSNLSENGIFIVGTPNIEFSKFSKEELKGSLINTFSGERLLRLMENYFNNVFMFTQNDEIIHTGFYPSANYLLALCCYKKSNI